MPKSQPKFDAKGRRLRIPQTTKYTRDPVKCPLQESEFDQIKECAVIQCTDVEIGHHLNFKYDVWLKVMEANPQIRDIIDQARSKGKEAVRMTQMKVALTGNVDMLKWWGKAHLGQNTNEVFVQTPTSSDLNVSEEAKQHLIELTEHIYARARDIETETLPPPAPDSKIIDIQSNGDSPH